jgi:tetratricopeptide (TPR) repeat protein
VIDQRGVELPRSWGVTLRWVGMVSIAAVCWVAYANALGAGFVYDDLVNITQRASLRWTELSLGNWWAALADSPSKRPVAIATFGLQYWAGWDTPRDFHAVNVAIHFGNALLVWRLAVALLRRCRGGAPLGETRCEVAGLFVALLFVAHPIQTQSVTYVVQRMNSLAAGAQLACLLFYIAGRAQSDPLRRGGLFLLGCVCWLLGLGSKESAAIMPVVVWLYEWYFERDLDREFLRQTGVALALVVAPTLAAGAVLVAMVGYDPMATYPVKDFTPLERLLSEPRVLVFYVSQLLWPAPSRLSLLHGFEVSRGLFQPWTTLPALVLVSGVLGLCAVAARRHRLLSFCGLWFFLQLAIESTVIPLALAMEHRLYLPLFGPSLALAYVIARLVQGRPAAQRLAIVVTVGCVIALAVSTHVRNRVWVSPESLWADVLEKYPNDFVARLNLGFHLANLGRHAEALEEYERAVALEPGDSRVHTNIGGSLLSLGRAEESVLALQRAVELDEQNPLAPAALGRALVLAGRNEEAIEWLRGVTRRGQDPDAWLVLGRVQMLEQQYAAARRSLGRAAVLAPLWAAPQEALGILALELSERDRAIGHFERALQLEPTAALHMHLGLAHWPSRDPARAVEHLEDAYRMAPGWAVVSNNLAWMLATARDPQIRDAPRALLLSRAVEQVAQGTDAEVLSTLAAALAANDRFDQAVSALDQAAAIARAQQNLAFEAEVSRRRGEYAAGRLMLEPEGLP